MSSHNFAIIWRRNTLCKTTRATGRYFHLESFNLKFKLKCRTWNRRKDWLWINRCTVLDWTWETAESFSFNSNRSTGNVAFSPKWWVFIEFFLASDLDFVEISSKFQVIRVAKGTLRVLIRSAMERIRLPSGEPYFGLVIQFLNLLLGDSLDSKNYWRDELAVSLRLSFYYRQVQVESWSWRESTFRSQRSMWSKWIRSDCWRSCYRKQA